MQYTKILAWLIALILVAPSAFALELQTAKAQGLVGERANGYLGSPKASASAEVKALIAEINAKRKKKYAEIAAKQGIKLNVVEKLAGEKAQKKTKSGHFIQAPNGAWQKR